MGLEIPEQPFYKTRFFHRIVGDYRLVKAKDWRVDFGCLVSTDFYFCRALVLADGNKVGLAHILPNADPQTYLASMLTAFPQRENVRVGIVQADWQYHFNLELLCQEQGLHVLTTVRSPIFYDDKWEINRSNPRDVLIHSNGTMKIIEWSNREYNERNEKIPKMISPRLYTMSLFDTPIIL